MSKYHSTFSRREFLKILGLGGASVGAAAVAPPVFHDLDEVMASPQANFKRPSWVKEVDKPTVEIDWARVSPFDGANVVWNPPAFEKAVGKAQADTYIAAGNANFLKWALEKKPGYSMKAIALKYTQINRYHTFLGERNAPTPEALSIPPYEGKPEENARMIRTFMRLHGASEVAFCELETDTTEKLIYRTDSSGVPYSVQDVAAPIEEKDDNNKVTRRIIPKKARWVIVYAMRMSEELNRRAPTSYGQRGAFEIYDQQCMLQQWLQNFTRTLGYNTMGWHDIRASLGTVAGWGVMSGLGETCRTMHIVTPEHGQMERVFHAITDLPLAPGKPIDAGIMRYCKTCKKCADACPVQAIPHDTEPYFDDSPAFFHRSGVRTWYRDEGQCRAYVWVSGGNSCGICDFICPYNKFYQAPYHNLVRRITAATPAFDRFFRSMDDSLGYGMSTGNDVEKFWDMDMPVWGNPL